MAMLTPLRRGVGAVGLGLALAATLGAGVAAANPIGVQARISFQGPGNGTGSSAHDALDPAIAYNSQRNTYLIAWSGDTTTAGEDEIWARLIAADGTPTGGVRRVSNMGPAGSRAFDGVQPKVAYNSAADEFLVVWQGDHNVGTVSGEEEIWGRRINGDGTFASGQFQISEMGANGSGAYEGFQPDAVYNANLNQYVVVWRGDQPTPGNGDDEIWARRLNPDGTSIDADDVRVSDLGAAGAAHDAREPEIAYNAHTGQYLVVFYGDDGNDEEFEIHGQLLGPELRQIGANDFLISETPGAAGDARSPEVAYNPVARRFLAVWSANKSTPAKTEIYAQLLDGGGAPVGTDDLRVSITGSGGNPDFDAFQAMVVSHERADEFLVAWYSDAADPGLAENENEIFAQRLTGAGVPVGTPGARVSTMGPDGDATYNAFGLIGGAYNAQVNEYLLSWEGDDDTGGLLDNEFELYARRHGAGTATEPFPANCTPVPSRGTPNEVRVPSTITTGYLKTNQRTGSATVRRANAVDKWLNAGILDEDLCGGSVAPEDLDPNLTATSGPLGPAPPQADPRPVAIAPAVKTNATFTANAIQMCINQRIYQAGIARANALKARLDAQLTGGDLVDGTLTQGRLRQDLTITAASDGPAADPSKTTVKQPQRQGCGAVTFTTTQAAINRRIAIQSVVRINEVLDEIAGGLDSANLKDGTITKADLAPELTP